MPKVGMQHHLARLTPRAVSEIRAHSALGTGASIAGLARKCGVDRKTIREARDGLTWKKVPTGVRCTICSRVVGVRSDGRTYKHGC